MKRMLRLTAFLFAGLFFFTVIAQTKAVTDYEFPDAMSKDVQKEYLKEFNKGKILYQINCGKCHNKTIKGKVIIPDFTPEQVANYELRIANPKHQADLIEDKILPEELGQITIFFTYKKKQATGK